MQPCPARIDSGKRYAWGAAALMFCLCTPALVLGQRGNDNSSGNSAESRKLQRSNPEILAAFRPAISKPSQCTVRVLSDGKEVALGTLVGPNGWILTKASELQGLVTCVLRDGRNFPARITGVEPKYDLAMLKIEAEDLPVVTWSQSKTAPVGHFVASTGTGDDPVAIGVISVAARKLPPMPTFRTTTSSGFLGVTMEPTESGVKVHEVDSGSPAAKAGFKAQDVILTVNGTHVTDAESYSAALRKAKESTGKTIVIRVRRNESDSDLNLKPEEATLEGLTLQSSMPGAPIREVSPDSAASKAGLKDGDILVGVDGKTIRDTQTMMDFLRQTKPGQQIALKVNRGKEVLDLKATLGTRPPTRNFDRGEFQNRMGSTLSNRRAGFPEILQHDTVLRPQDCGGPLVDLDGHIVGINIARAGRVESFAIPSESIEPILADLMSGKLPPPAGLEGGSNPEERVSTARAHLSAMEIQKAALEKRLQETRRALADAEADLRAKKAAEAKEKSGK